jgi:RNA recognition motif-containing protein
MGRLASSSICVGPSINFVFHDPPPTISDLPFTEMGHFTAHGGSDGGSQGGDPSSIAGSSSAASGTATLLAGCALYVGNLPPAADEYAVASVFSAFGPLAHVQIIRERSNQASKGYGFVTYSHPAYATVAMQHLNGQVLTGPFGGQRIKVAPSNKRQS